MALCVVGKTPCLGRDIRLILIARFRNTNAHEERHPPKGQYYPLGGSPGHFSPSLLIFFRLSHGFSPSCRLSCSRYTLPHFHDFPTPPSSEDGGFSCRWCPRFSCQPGRWGFPLSPEIFAQNHGSSFHVLRSDASLQEPAARVCPHPRGLVLPSEALAALSRTISEPGPFLVHWAAASPGCGKSGHRVSRRASHVGCTFDIDVSHQLACVVAATISHANAGDSPGPRGSPELRCPDSTIPEVPVGSHP